MAFPIGSSAKSGSRSVARHQTTARKGTFRWRGARRAPEHQTHGDRPVSNSGRVRAAGPFERLIRRCCRRPRPRPPAAPEATLPGASRVSDIAAMARRRRAQMKRSWSRPGDGAAVHALVAGVEAIVHLGGVSVEGPFEPILQANIVGAWNSPPLAR